MTRRIHQRTTSPSRRKAFKVLVGAGAAITAAKALPERWTRPAIDAVILPAHAQATGGPFVITACGAESLEGAPAGSLYQVGPADTITNLSATVSPPPPTGTAIRMIPTHTDATGPVYSEQVGTTDASGVASNFPFNIGLPNGDPLDLGTVFTLRYEFDDQATFGASFCEVTLTVVARPS